MLLHFRSHLRIVGGVLRLCNYKNSSRSFGNSYDSPLEAAVVHDMADKDLTAPTVESMIRLL
jgi:hypothetical protein